MTKRPAVPVLLCAVTLGWAGMVHAQTAPGADAVVARFQPSDADFPNPERGFYRSAESDLDALTEQDAADAFAEGYRLMYVRIDLGPYRGRDLPPEFLARLETGFDAARRSGVKLIFRAAYNYPEGETGYQQAQDAPLPVVLSHLAQLKPLLQANADVIAFMQAGFIGAWGEWHTSSNDLTTPGNKRRIRDALLDAVPATRFIQFRYPPDLQGWADDPAIARAGFHNDCFLASTTDVGTYDEDAAPRTAQRQFTGRLGDAAPFGGETCNPADDPDPRPRDDCRDILFEGEFYNLVYLNAGYYRPLFHQRWAREGCMDEVRRRMGYRLSLIDASWPSTVEPGGALELSATLTNDGWARLHNPRAVVVLLRDGTGAVRRLATAGANPRDWLPGQTATVELRVVLPPDLAKGEHQLLIALPDADARLAGDPRYAVRFANADDAAAGQGWDAALGAFALGGTVRIGADQ